MKKIEVPAFQELGLGEEEINEQGHEGRAWIAMGHQERGKVMVEGPGKLSRDNL